MSIRYDFQVLLKNYSTRSQVIDQHRRKLLQWFLLLSKLPIKRKMINYF